MDAERRELIEALFEEALELPAAERSAWLAQKADGDAELEAEVLALLAAHDLDDRLLDRGAGGFAREVEDDPMRGRRIGPYRVVREIGRGGMGVVYLAERDDGQFRRRVALKLLRKGPDAGELHRRFLAERQILASLAHPNIAQLLDGGVTEGLLPYLVMEHVEGFPITDYCDRLRLDLRSRLRLFCDVCSAVHHAHQNLVLHRDLKPSNVLVTTEGQVKLLDFGIAKLMNPGLSAVDVPVTRTEFRMLTPEYASPEQVRGEPLNTASDVYSLGVLLYELLAGHSPYHTTRNTPHELAGAVMTHEPDRPSTRAGTPRSLTLPAGTTRELTPTAIAEARDTTPERLRRQLRGDLDAIVLMALRKEPSRRFASAALLAQDIERHLDGQPVAAHRGSRAYRAAKLLRRHRIEAIAAGLLAIALIGGAGASLRQSRIAESERARAEEARLQAEQALDESREVTAFLMGLFSANDPASARGDQITARELLERGIARSDELSDRPLLQAQLLEVVGRVSINLGQYARGEELLERSLATRSAQLGSRHPVVATTLNSLANAIAHQGRYAEAEPLYREALAIRQEALPPDDPAIARSLHDLGVLLSIRGDGDGAEASFRESIEIGQRALGPEHPDVLSTESRLGVVLINREQLDEAEAMLTRTLALKRKVHGEVHPEVATDLLQLGMVALKRQDAAGYDSLFKQTLEIRRKLYGDEHPSVAQSLVTVAIALAEQGDHARAEPLYQEGIETQRRLLGPDHPRVGHALNSLGILQLETGDLANAERTLREAIRIATHAYATEHTDLGFSMENLGRVLAAAGRSTEAEAIYRETIALRLRLLGDRHPHVAQTSRYLADLLRDQRRYREAEPLYLQALGIYEERGTTTRVDEIRSQLATLYASLGELAEADRYR